MPVSAPGTREADWDRITFQEVWKLADSEPAAGVHVQDTQVYKRDKDAGGVITEWMNALLSEEPWFKDLTPGFRKLEKYELPDGVDSGTTFKSVCINVAIYLPWLASQCLARGVVIKRAILSHIKEAEGLHHTGRKTGVVVNCTGLMARSLGGVMDESVIPVLGQIAVVSNTAPAMVAVSGTEDGEDENTYIMMRPAGGGTVLGGCYRKNVWRSQPDPSMAARIMKRAVEICPELVKPGQGAEGLGVIRHVVGLRPLRVGGVRLEKEVIDGVKVVHNYGAGGFGYQASYGMATYAVRLVDEATSLRAKI